jgi:predicted acyl esterase
MNTHTTPELAALKENCATTAYGNREPVHKGVVEKNVAMHSHDGVSWCADVYRPGASGKFPVLFHRYSSIASSRVRV